MGGRRLRRVFLNEGGGNWVGGGAKKKGGKCENYGDFRGKRGFCCETYQKLEQELKDIRNAVGSSIGVRGGR